MAIAREWEVDYACGHSELRDLSDIPAGKRAGRAEWLTKQQCFDCFKAKNGTKMSKEIAAERAAELAEAEADAERQSLAVLRGSEKQVTWAIKVRYEMMRDAYATLVEGGALSEADYDAQVIDRARQIDLAHWWIDNRETDVTDLPELLADAGLTEAASSSENPF